MSAPITLFGKQNVFNIDDLKKEKSIDAIYKVYETCLDKFEDIDSETFNIFSFTEKVGRQNSFILIATHLFLKWDAFDLYVDVGSYAAFISKIAFGYRKANPYHNDIHAADVTQMCNVFLTKGEASKIFKLETKDIFALILSALCHDLKHPGLSNSYHINSRSKLAIRYND
jgi:cAMP-specific phosphodiesterase 4